MRTQQWIAATLLVFALVYAASLSFVHVEGDAATSIAFHVLGRDASVQRPYFPHQGMMDLWLCSLPPHEPLLRVAGIALSAVAAVLFFIFSLMVVFQFLPEITAAGKTRVALAALLACPELFYLGLFYDPCVVAMSWLLTAHLLMRGASRRPGFAAMLRAGLAALAFGLGAAFRWDAATYGLVIVADRIFGGKGRRETARDDFRWRLGGGIAWGVGALLAAGGAIWLTGSNPATVAHFLTWGMEMAAGESPYSGHFDLRTLLNALSLFSPGALVLGLLGFAILIARRRRLALIVAVGLALALPWASMGIPKYMLPAVPALLTCLAVGLATLEQCAAGRPRRAVGLGLAVGLLLVAPWIVGLRVDDASRSWGPGFHPRPYDQGASPGPAGEPRPTSGQRRVWPVVGPGLALPTSEGPRPIGGHAGVLLAGGWRTLAHNLDGERQRAISRALDLGLPLLQDRGEGYAVSHLAARGFSTRDPAASIAPPDAIGPVARVFGNPDGDRLLVLRCRDRRSLTRGGEELQRMGRVAGRWVVIYGYGATLRSLHELAPGALQPLGPASAILDLQRLQEVVAAPSGAP